LDDTGLVRRVNIEAKDYRKRNIDR